MIEIATAEPIIQGESIFLNSSNSFINVTPHTITTQNYVEISLMNKNYTDTLNIEMGFNNSKITPGKIQLYSPENITKTYTYTCTETIGNNANYAWCTINDQQNGTTKTEFNHTYTSIDQKNKVITWEERELVEWADTNVKIPTKYYSEPELPFWFEGNLSLMINLTYRIRIYFDYHLENIQDIPQRTKYSIGIKPKSLSIEEATLQNKYDYIDPWINGTSIQENLIAYYTMDEPSEYYYNALDNTQYINATNDTYITGAKVNNSALLNYTHDLPLITQGGINYSICFWLNYSNNVSASNYPDFLDEALVAGKGFGIVGHKTNGYVQFQWNAGGQLAQSNNGYMPTTKNWQYYCLIRNNLWVGFYRNGTLWQNVTNAAWTTAIPPNQSGYINGYTRMKGMFDEMGWWNRTLTNAEISSLYNSGDGIGFYSQTTSTCTYTSGTWNINCTHECNLTTTQIYGNLVNITGSGRIWGLMNLTNYTLSMPTGGCEISIQ